MLKNASKVTPVPKNIFFLLKILNFVQSFVGCKVSLADGILESIALIRNPRVNALLSQKFKEKEKGSFENDYHVNGTAL
jgi:hypothetical protein